MFLMLMACGLLNLFMGEPIDAAMLLGFVFIVMGTTIVQECRTQRALDALRELSSPHSLGIRDDRQRRVTGREVLRGDSIVLIEGDRVPADATLRYVMNLAADESLLTGESVPDRKAASAEADVLGKPGETSCLSSSPVFSSSAGRACSSRLASGGSSGAAC